ncbi:unnamed protein product [Symbiodinium necroappetens]|uniref:Uncharacterized protein n=1 Tax=Symbiodinium necroappetens TaxID=1628268 RepID=A0A812XZR4_9DINO|nr:unnamed protein product [Symbiodinium necroappetens]
MTERRAKVRFLERGVDSQRGPRSSVHRLGEDLKRCGPVSGPQFAHHLTQLGATQGTLRHRRICDGERSGPAGHPRSDCRGCVARRCCSGRRASGNGSRVCFRSTGAVAAASSTGGRAVPQTSLTRRPRYGWSCHAAPRAGGGCGAVAMAGQTSVRANIPGVTASRHGGALDWALGVEVLEGPGW